VTAFKLRRERSEAPICTVKLGALRAEGGTRGRTFRVGGSTAMPSTSGRGNAEPSAGRHGGVRRGGREYPRILRDYFGELLHNPAAMAKVWCGKYGADLISVRLEGTHPEKGNRTPAQAVEIVKAVLAAVDVPLIITGHSHFDRNNEVLKAVAAACAGENLLLNWVEQNNYRTIAGAAMAYGHWRRFAEPNRRQYQQADEHSAHQHGPQTRADRHRSANGTHGVRTRIHVFGHGTDPPDRSGRRRNACVAYDCFAGAGMCQDQGIENPRKRPAGVGRSGQACNGVELTTAMSLLYAGADILIMYNPDAAIALKRAITRLMTKRGRFQHRVERSYRWP